MYEEITRQANQAVKELLEAARMEPGELLVIGCSSSEMIGEQIGHGSSLDAARAAWDGVSTGLDGTGVRLAVQCCEHLNRALIVEQETARHFGYEIVNVRPQPKAGGSFAVMAWEHFAQPAAVEHIRAKAGLDIGGTLIGMHLREVAVPVRLSLRQIGRANLLCARTRPKFIGGERACYVDELK